jgi:hypothetical protein
MTTDPRDRPLSMSSVLIMLFWPSRSPVSARPKRKTGAPESIDAPVGPSRLPVGGTTAGRLSEAVQFRRVNPAAQPRQARPQLIASALKEGGKSGRHTQMAEPIANDWKAIHDRMQQIKSEESTALWPCPRCKDRGWMPVYRAPQRTHSFTTCDLCHNPRSLPPPGL